MQFSLIYYPIKVKINENGGIASYHTTLMYDSLKAQKEDMARILAA